jgi:hypothetical protein
MKLAIVVGGWHWPLHFFINMKIQAYGADLFVIAHRNPELPLVREEKVEILANAPGFLGKLDRELYFEFPTVGMLRKLGWQYSEEPNTVGDWGFFNQWLEKHQDYTKYDMILNCHDDTYMRGGKLFNQLAGDWLLLANGRYPGAPDGYVRGSFEFWKPELLEAIGGRFDLGNIRLTREGKIDSPEERRDLSDWNKTAMPLRRFMVKRNFHRRIQYLSPYYRISQWVIEGERGFLHKMRAANLSFKAGVEKYLQ